jgi:hypothetical protein
MQAAIAVGWYEVALWGISLLEVYNRDFHKLAYGEKVEEWSQVLISLIQTRHQAVTRKLSISERKVASRVDKGWTLPRLPGKETWGAYMQAYAELIHAAYHSSFLEALGHLQQMLDLLLGFMPFLQRYVQFHMALSCLNLIIILLNLRAWDLYEQAHQAWRHLWERGYWPQFGRYKDMNRVSMGIHLIFLIQMRKWEEARRTFLKEKDHIQELIFHSKEEIGFRVQVASCAYLALLLSPSTYRESVSWHLQVEAWMERERFRDYPYLWWVFLRWFEAYRHGDPTWMRHWYRKLRIVWQAHFAYLTRWGPVLRVLKSLCYSIAAIQRKRVQQLLRHWEKHPEERLGWEGGAAVFPMTLFIESLIQRRPLEETLPIAPLPTALPEEMEKHTHTLICKLMDITSSKRVR